MDLTEILTATEIERLRRNFKNTDMVAAASSAVAGSYPRGQPWTDDLLRRFYQDDDSPLGIDQQAAARSRTTRDSSQSLHRRAMSRSDVERVVIGLFAAQGCNWALSVHVYWGLCMADDPLDVAEIAEVILLASTYAGVWSLTQGHGVLAATLKALKVLANDTSRAPEPMVVVPALLTMFPYAPGPMPTAGTP